MKMLCLFLFLVFTGCLYAQSDSIEYIRGLPVTHDDTTDQSVGDHSPKKKLVAVRVEEMPPRLKETLDSNTLYKGWQDSTVLYDLNTKLYIVHIRQDSIVSTYGFNESGKPVTFNEITTHKKQ